MNDKIYWSNNNFNKWDDSGDYMTFFLIPRKWWSWGAWKFSFSMRSAILEKCVGVLRTEPKGE